MEINILEHPKPKSFFEEKIEKLSKIPFFVWSGEAISSAIFSAMCFAMAVFLYSTTHMAETILFSVLGFIVTIWFLIIILQNRKVLWQTFEKKINSLSEADPERCIQIEKWLENQDIKSFIHKVVTLEYRKLTACEVDAMEAFYATSLVKEAAAERQEEIDAACKKVYFDPLLNP